MSRAVITLLLMLFVFAPLAPTARAGAPTTPDTKAQSIGALPPGNRISWQGQDWYLNGVNMAWVNWGRDFGGGESNGGVSSAESRATLNDRLATAKANGANVIRWWVFEGENPWQIKHDDSGPTGLDESIYPDFDAAMELAEAHDLTYVFVLFSAPSHLPSSWLDDGAQRKKLANALAPLFARYADNPRVMSWEVFNEPDFDVWKEKTREDSMRETVREIGAAVHANSPALVTVGMAMLDGLPMVKGLGLDYYQAHWYDYMQPGNWCALCTDYAEVQSRYDLDAPLVIGEFYLGSDVESPHVRLEDFYNKGYAGAWAWSLYPESTHDKLEIDWNSMRIFGGRHDDLGPRKTPTLPPSTSAPTERLNFSTNAQAGQPRVARGGKMPVDAKVTSTAGVKALIDIEIYSPSGEKVHQQAFDNQSFGPGEMKVVTTVWNVPVDAAPGEYMVKVGVFTPGWGKLHVWNDTAAKFTVD